MINLGHNLCFFFFLLREYSVVNLESFCACFKHVLPWKFHFVLSSAVTKPLCYVAGIILLNFQPCPPSLLVYAIIMDEQGLISVLG